MQKHYIIKEPDKTFVTSFATYLGLLIICKRSSIELGKLVAHFFRVLTERINDLKQLLRFEADKIRSPVGYARVVGFLSQFLLGAFQYRRGSGTLQGICRHDLG